MRTSASSGSCGHQQARPVELGQVRSQLGLDVEPGAGVERGQRFVEQQQLGRRRPALGPGDPLGLAAGQRGRFPVGQSVQAQAVAASQGPPSAPDRVPCPLARGENATFSSTLRCGNNR